MAPSSVSVMIASCEEATTAARRTAGGSTTRGEDICPQIILLTPTGKAQQRLYPLDLVRVARGQRPESEVCGVEDQERKGHAEERIHEPELVVVTGRS